MKTLKERQADRAARKIENAKLAETNNTGADRIGDLASQMKSLEASFEQLTPEERQELSARLQNGGEVSADYKPAEVFPMAGIGVVNPFVVPVGEQGGNGAGDGAEQSGGDAFSAAVAAASWGTGAPADASPPAPATEGQGGNEAADETLNEDGSPKTKAQLQEILKGREVSFESDANHARLTELVKANPAPAQA